MFFKKAILSSLSLAIALCPDTILGQVLQETAKVTYPPQQEASGNRYMLKVLSSTEVPDDANGETEQAEFFTYDKDLKRLYVVNSLPGIVNVFQLTETGELTFLLKKEVNGQPQSLAYNDGIVAVAVANADGNANGSVEILDAKDDLKTLHSVEVGVLPDHVSFGTDSKCLFVANEAEGPATGGITQICSEDGFETTPDSKTVLFSDVAALTDEGDAILASDLVFEENDQEIAVALSNLEPEYITYGPEKDGKFEVYVVLQESNGIAVFSSKGTNGEEIEAPTLERIVPLGFKDYGAEPNAMDLIKDTTPNLQLHPGVFGVFQPDTVHSFTVKDKNYIAFANEGDSWSEEKVEDLIAAGKIADSLLGTAGKVPDLEVIPTKGLNAEGKYDALYSFGGRSFSFFDPETNDIVFDSGNQMSKMMLEYVPELFNVKDGEGNKEKDGELTSNVDNRSGKKGGEPEAIVFGTADDGAKLAFVTLERPSLIGIWEIKDVNDVYFHSYNTDVDCDNVKSKINDPEALKFIPADESPVGVDILIATGSKSNSITVFALTETKNKDDLYLFQACKQSSGSTKTSVAFSLLALFAGNFFMNA